MYLKELCADLSEEEREVIETLRQRTINEFTPKMLDDDSVCFRFCKARDFNLEAAESMLRKNIAWKKELGIEHFTDDDIPEACKRYMPCARIGYAKDGCLVGYWHVGGTDFKGLHKSVTEQEFLRFNANWVEKDFDILHEHNKKTNQTATKTIYIHDHRGLTLSKALDKKTLMLCLYQIKLYQDHYPERSKLLFEINTPPYFTLMFNILKSVIAGPLMKKIKVYGTTGYQEELLKYIDADVLPKFLGGNRTDPDGDPSCRTFMRQAELVPRRYYLSSIERSVATDTALQSLFIKRSSKEEVCVEVEAPGSELVWEVFTGDKDIDFAVHFRDHSWNSDHSVEVVPRKRILSVRKPVEGSCACQNPGTYILIFDNTYSWIHPKEVLYKTCVRSPKISEVN